MNCVAFTEQPLASSWEGGLERFEGDLQQCDLTELSSAGNAELSPGLTWSSCWRGRVVSWCTSVSFGLRGGSCSSRQLYFGYVFNKISLSCTVAVPFKVWMRIGSALLVEKTVYLKP